MKLIYVAGPYRGANGNEVTHNIWRARCTAEIIIQAFGRLVSVLVPHMNTAHMDGLMPDGYWIDADMAWLAHADVLYVMPGSNGSRGVQAEIEFCENHDIPVCRCFEALRKFVGDGG